MSEKRLHNLADLSVKDLRDRCKAAGLPVSGPKEDLVTRIRDKKGSGARAKGSSERVQEAQIAVPVEQLLIPEVIEEQAAVSGKGVVVAAEALTISDDDDYAAAGKFLTERVKPALKELEGAFGPIVRSWHAGHKQTIETKNRLMAPFLAAEKSLKRAMSAYVLRRHREREEEAARIAQKAAEIAEEEITARALELIEEGEDDQAEEMLAELEGDVEVSAPPVVRVDPVATGTSARMLKRFRVVNEAAIRREYLMPDEKKIKRALLEHGFDAAKIVGGIEVYEEASIGASARR